MGINYSSAVVYRSVVGIHIYIIILNCIVSILNRGNRHMIMNYDTTYNSCDMCLFSTLNRGLKQQVFFQNLIYDISPVICRMSSAIDQPLRNRYFYPNCILLKFKMFQIM